ncbi:MAG: hypothetical protein IMX05_07925 [Hydrogenibacillus schlegelii]|nr:hypothetical protein [Hydrogenibacillus schlegelii]
MGGKVIIVEGKTDAERLKSILAEPVTFVLTHGTPGPRALEAIEALRADEVYVFVDADFSGERIRRAVAEALPEARHLFTRKMYREIATTPLVHLAEVLMRAHFAVDLQAVRRVVEAEAEADPELRQALRRLYARERRKPR